MEELADRLIRARTKKGMTQEELANAAGVSQSTIGNLESRLRRSARRLAVIANVLGVSAYWLETGDGSPEGKPSDELLEQVAALTPAERRVVAAVVAGLRGVSVGVRHGAEGSVGNDEYEARILSMIREMDERAKGDAEAQLREILREQQEFTAREPESGTAKTHYLGTVPPNQARKRKS